MPRRSLLPLPDPRCWMNSINYTAPNYEIVTILQLNIWSLPQVYLPRSQTPSISLRNSSPWFIMGRYIPTLHYRCTLTLLLSCDTKGLFSSSLPTAYFRPTRGDILVFKNGPHCAYFLDSSTQGHATFTKHILLLRYTFCSCYLDWSPARSHIYQALPTHVFT
jgi:hypothetical protein